jgi:hypothetical protein
VSFADVAIMAPVPGRGLHTPMVASGPGAEAASSMLSACGARWRCFPGRAAPRPPGSSCAACSTRAWPRQRSRRCSPARSADCEDWLREHIAAELAAADRGTLTRIEEGSYRHAGRRAHEMAAAGELLDELSVPARVARAGQHWLEYLARRG